MKTKTFNDISQRNKEDFISLYSSLIELRDSLSSFYDKVFLPAVDKFDGKVLNKRFKTYLQEEANKLSNGFWFNEDNWTRNENGPYLSLNLYAQKYCGKFGYLKENIHLCIRYDENGRINKDKTVNDPLFQAWKTNFDKFTNGIEDAISNYDEYAKRAFSLYETIEDFNKLPYYFRYNLRKSYFHIYGPNED